MTDSSLRRFTAIAGIVGVILYVLGNALISDLPPINTSAHTIATYAANH